MRSAQKIAVLAVVLFPDLLVAFSLTSDRGRTSQHEGSLRRCSVRSSSLLNDCRIPTTFLCESKTGDSFDNNDDTQDDSVPVHVGGVSSSVLSLSASSSALGTVIVPEWHDSFLRNGFGDFVPSSMSSDDVMNCVVVGQQEHFAGAPSQQSTTDTQDHSEWIRDGLEAQAAAMSKDEDHFRKSLSVSPLPTETSSESTLSRSSSFGLTQAPLYDCILDYGLMDSILSVSYCGAAGDLLLNSFLTEPSTRVQGDTETQVVVASSATKSKHVSSAMQRSVGAASASTGSMTAMVALLLQEASQVLQEHGIYIVLVRPSLMTPVLQDYLRSIGQVVGIQWTFGLDGISNDDVCVSVARRFFTGTLSSSPKATASFCRLVQSAFVSQSSHD